MTLYDDKLSVAVVGIANVAQIVDFHGDELSKGRD